MAKEVRGRGEGDGEEGGEGVCVTGREGLCRDEKRKAWEVKSLVVQMTDKRQVRYEGLLP